MERRRFFKRFTECSWDTLLDVSSCHIIDSWDQSRRDCHLDTASTNEWDRWDQESHQKSDSQRAREQSNPWGCERLGGVPRIPSVLGRIGVTRLLPSHSTVSYLQVRVRPVDVFWQVQTRFESFHSRIINTVLLKTKPISERKKQKIPIWDFVIFMGIFSIKVIGKFKLKIAATSKIGTFFLRVLRWYWSRRRKAF